MPPAASGRPSTTRPQKACVRDAKPWHPPPRRSARPMQAALRSSETGLTSPEPLQWCLSVVDGPLTRKIHRRHARKRQYQLAEGVSAHLEVAILVERGAGRGQQHCRLFRTGVLGIAGGQRNRTLQRSGDDIRHMPFQLGGKCRGSLTDEIGLAQAREEACQRGDTTGLGPAARDPENIGETGQRLGCRIRHWWLWNR